MLSSQKMRRWLCGAGTKRAGGRRAGEGSEKLGKARSWIIVKYKLKITKILVKQQPFSLADWWDNIFVWGKTTLGEPRPKDLGGYFQFNSVQLLSRVQLLVTPWTAARQASLSITNSQSLLKLMSIESVMPASHLILCLPLLLLPPIPPSTKVFYNESTLRMRWPKYWSFSFSISPSNEHPGLISFRMDWLDPLAVQGTLKNL